MSAYLTILIGIPGSGKSTLARRLAAATPEALLVSTDALREELMGHIRNKTRDGMIFAEARRRAGEALAQGRPVIYDATNVTRAARGPFLDLARELDVDAHAAWVCCRKELALQRNRQREFPVPDQAIDEMTAGLEPPTAAEGFAAIHEYPEPQTDAL